MSIPEIKDLLTSIPRGQYTGERLLLEALPKLLAASGIPEDRIAFEHVIHRDGSVVGFVDAVVRAEDGSVGVVVEVKSFTPNRWDVAWIDQTKRLRKAAGAPGSLLLTAGRLWGELGGIDMDIVLSDAKDEDAKRLQLHLSKVLATPQSPTSGEDRCKGRLIAVEEAKTNRDKQDTLEEFARWCIEREAGVSVKHRNLRTHSSEIDLVGEVGNQAPRGLSDHGRYFLVECKNWRSPVGAKEIRDFVGKLVKTQCSLGILFSKAGVTGANDSKDALREIRFCFDHLHVSVCVMSRDECEAMCAGVSLSDLVDKKLEALRFDLR